MGESFAMNTISFTILGQVYSLKNTRAPITIVSKKTGKPRTIFVPNNEARKFERAFKKQLPESAKQNLATAVSIEMEIFYPTNMQDLDPALVLDCMQRYGVIENDRQVVALYCEKRIDRANPRVVVRVQPVAWDRTGQQSRLLDDAAEKPEMKAVV